MESFIGYALFDIIGNAREIHTKRLWDAVSSNALDMDWSLSFGGAGYQARRMLQFSAILDWIYSDIMHTVSCDGDMILHTAHLGEFSDIYVHDKKYRQKMRKKIDMLEYSKLHTDACAAIAFRDAYRIENDLCGFEIDLTLGVIKLHKRNDAYAYSNEYALFDNGISSVHMDGEEFAIMKKFAQDKAIYYSLDKKSGKYVPMKMMNSFEVMSIFINAAKFILSKPILSLLHADFPK